MIRYGILVTFLLAVQLSSVLGGNHFYEYYYSKYHHKHHSTTTALSSSTAEISTEQKVSSPVSGDDDSLESAEHSSTVGSELTHHKNRTSHSYGYNEYNDNVEYDFALRVGIIAGCSTAFVVGSCCLFCCIRACRRRNAVRRGFIIADRRTAARPLQPAVGHHHPPQQVPNQYPPQYQEESAHLFPPKYQPQVLMQRQYSPQQPTYQSQYSPQQLPYQSEYSPTAPQDHNPPEAPPPYEFPEKF